MQRIHIVGCGPRTGTTLMAEMMAACFEIDLYPKHENSIYTRPTRPAKIFLTKRPRDILVVGPMLRLNPNLHVIYMLRDPRDMVSSKHRKDPDRYWASLRYWNTYTIYGRKLQHHPRFITIRYEDLVTQADSVQAYLMQRITFLTKRASFTRYHEIAKPDGDSLAALKGIRPVSSQSIGNWRNHLPRIAAQLHNHGDISQDLIDYGYEPDNNWLKELENVTPDFSPSHWEEYFTQEELARRLKWKYIKPIFALLPHFSYRANNQANP
ncbi:MAG: sulfotransferase [Xenococcaceae cyanobacterium]